MYIKMTEIPICCDGISAMFLKYYEMSDVVERQAENAAFESSFVLDIFTWIWRRASFFSFSKFMVSRPG